MADDGRVDAERRDGAGAPIRCAVLGNAGGGKSVLARVMSSKLGLPLHELDALLWREGWRQTPDAEFRREHDDLLRGERWIVDGFGTVESIGPRIERCTHAVYVDLPIWLHFALAAERQAAWRSGELRHPPGGMPSPPPTRHLFELMWRIHTELAPVVKAALAEVADGGTCRVVFVETLDQLRALQRDPASLLR